MDRVHVPVQTIAFRRTGAGLPLLLLHGLMADSGDWSHQFEVFPADFTVIAWDAPGCGQSDDVPMG